MARTVRIKYGEITDLVEKHFSTVPHSHVRRDYISQGLKPDSGTPPLMVPPEASAAASPVPQASAYGSDVYAAVPAANASAIQSGELPPTPQSGFGSMWGAGVAVSLTEPTVGGGQTVVPLKIRVLNPFEWSRSSTTDGLEAMFRELDQRYPGIKDQFKQQVSSQVRLNQGSSDQDFSSPGAQLEWEKNVGLSRDPVGAALADILAGLGYDGLIIKNPDGSGTALVFSDSQIQPVTRNIQNAPTSE